MSQLDEHLPHLRKPPIEYRPELRWWLAEGLHTDATLRAEIEAAHRLGFGGMEFLAMDEEAIDHSRYGWGSEEWVHDSGIVVEETTARNMSVSFTSGTNWSNANLPTIDPDHPAAAQELNYVVEHVQRGSGRRGALPRVDLLEDRVSSQLPGHRVPPTQQHLVAVLAAPVVSAEAEPVVLDVEGIVDLTGEVVGEALDWEPTDDRSWQLLVFWSHGTGQTASPSVSVNYTVNYLERAGVDAVIDYWRGTVLTPELREQIARNPRAQMYMDSLELTTWGAGGMFWGPSVAQEFRTRRGYDIAPWLPFLTREVMLMASATAYRYEPDDAHAGVVAKVRHDYVQTLTDLYIENMLRPFAAFLHENGILLRSEISYGLPFELTRPGPEVDGIETESLEFAAQIDAYRLLAGPAHLFGKQYSSETGATTRNHMLDHRFYDQIIATQLAAGVTKTVLHGWASTAGAEGVTHWPGHEGMWPMFSERFDLRQPASEFYPLWNDAIGRFQYLLRQGRPRIDVGILRTDHFVDNMLGMSLVEADGTRVADEDAYAHWWMRNRENPWWQDLGMQDAGWSYEFFDGSLLLRDEVGFGEGVVQPGGPGYQALIVYQEALDADVAARLLQWARQGLRVLLVNGARELKLFMARLHTTHERAAARTPGLDGRDAELVATMAALRALPVVAEVDDPADTVSALRGLGVTGRAEFVAENRNVLTYLREDGDLVHLYAYHFLYESGEPTTVEVALPGKGLVSRVDPWSGAVSAHGGVRSEGGRTVVALTLAPGETALVTLDRSTGAVESAPVEAVELARLDRWEIRVESWDAGEPEVVTEDRGLGYVTCEVHPTTAVTDLAASTDELAPWSALPGVGPEVSGVGEYRSAFDLDARPEGRVVLDLGSTCGGLGSVVVNDAPARGFDTSRPVVDVTDAVRAGRNEVTIRVSSSLNNRLIARGYYDAIPDILLELAGRQGVHATRVREHGLVGPVRVLGG
ncbi:glycosyl hydrolase [Actinotalea sp. M2MS4P-6]|uniref:glycosyl hydrolase n=1 Tax=Actinotalea sp. M2MS4P-6 TaxID=2983762 RepID=UPI0021E4C6C0|nr:glycosyl hydrolase [Actinotalea sp. M2MS4P-6]MCV2394293.1 glycosyl hydrolase [Actinotalea sp. M2MS4P-6]